MKAKHSERGASLAETAIVMSVVLLLMFGIIDFGRAIYTYSHVATLAREGARWMIVRGSQACSGPIDHCNAGSSDVQTYLQSLNPGAITASRIVATATFTPCTVANNPNGGGPNGPGCFVSVRVQYPFAFIAPFVHSANIQMSSTSQMVISQ